jgi:hypothetical protein
MYIPGFIVGVVATLFAEVALMILGIIVYNKNHRGDL